ncbi:MAG TPA: hypothetical protein DEA62_03040 [Coxiellaceae bacterium]|nr:hypothetical protein [Coxiellaceae bacterium]
MMNNFTFTMREKNSYDYVYIDENNQVHLLCPLIGGDTIGLDNTCKSTKEICQFFGTGTGIDPNKTAVAILTTYRSDLENDIALLQPLQTLTDDGKKLLQEKIDRLEQINKYLVSVKKVLSQNNQIANNMHGISGRYPSEIRKLLEQQTNCLSILLSPKEPDPVLNGAGYVFRMQRKKQDLYGRLVANDISGEALREEFSSDIIINTAGAKDELLKKIKDNWPDDITFDANFDDFMSKVRAALQKNIKEQTGQDIDLSQSQQGEEVNKGYFATILGIEENDTVSPSDVASYILSACISDDFWKNLSSGPFVDAAALPDATRPEKLSILTQFFLAEVNVFCFAQKKSTQNFGAVLDANTNQIRTLLATTIKNALKENQNIEESLIACINKNQTIFGLSEEITKEEAKKIIDRFNIDYRTVSDSPHMDEFILFLPEATGEFVTHKNRISFLFSHFTPDDDFSKKHLTAFSARKGNRLSHTNNIVNNGALNKQELSDEQLVDILKNNPSTLAKMLLQDDNFSHLSSDAITAIRYSPFWDGLKKAVDSLTKNNQNLQTKFYDKFSSTSLTSIKKFIDENTWLDKATLITLLSHNSKSNLTTQEKNSNRKILLERIRKEPTNWTVRILSFMASYKWTAGIATYILSKGDKKNKELYGKPKIIAIAPPIVVEGKDSSVISDALKKEGPVQKKVLQETNPENTTQNVPQKMTPVSASWITSSSGTKTKNPSAP